MNQEIHFSDEFLNAFIDGELSHADEVQLLSAIAEDELLNQRLCQLQRVRSLLQLAYHDAAPSDHPQADDDQTAHRNTAATAWYVTAACVLLSIGAFSGWLAYNTFNKQPSLLELAKEIRTNERQYGKSWNLMVQVSSNDTNRFNVLLDETERLLESAKHNNEQVRIQILANSTGINLLKDDQSPVALRVSNLQKKYDNLILSACSQTLKKLRQQNKEVPLLLEQTRIVPSALQETIEKQRQGWTYIKI